MCLTIQVSMFDFLFSISAYQAKQVFFLLEYSHNVIRTFFDEITYECTTTLLPCRRSTTHLIKASLYFHVVLPNRKIGG